MERAYRAWAGARHDDFRGLARIIVSPSASRLHSAEPILRRAVPFLVVLFVAVLIGAVAVKSTNDRQETGTDHAANAMMALSLVQARINDMGPETFDGLDPTSIRTRFADIIPPSVLRDGRAVYLVAPSDAILASAIVPQGLGSDGLALG
ncbi:MAG: hypothetical protein AAF638_09045, partial [Pseudomonadota bacterium]